MLKRERDGNVKRFCTHTRAHFVNCQTPPMTEKTPKAGSRITVQIGGNRPVTIVGVSGHVFEADGEVHVEYDWSKGKWKVTQEAATARKETDCDNK